jgi:hypothetical protein
MSDKMNQSDSQWINADRAIGKPLCLLKVTDDIAMTRAKFNSKFHFEHVDRSVKGEGI